VDRNALLSELWTSVARLKCGVGKSIHGSDKIGTQPSLAWVTGPT
jgi:hypothetical protein